MEQDKNRIYFLYIIINKDFFFYIKNKRESNEWRLKTWFLLSKSTFFSLRFYGIIFLFGYFCS